MHIYSSTHIPGAAVLMLLWGTLLYVFGFTALAEALGRTLSLCCAWSFSSYNYFLRILNSEWWKTMFSSSFNDIFSCITVTTFSSILFALGWLGFKFLGLQKGSEILVFLTNVKCGHSGLSFPPLNPFLKRSVILKFFSPVGSTHPYKSSFRTTFFWAV